MARLVVASTGRVLAERVSWAQTPVARARGLIGRRLRSDECLVLRPASQIHTVGLGYPIDVVYLDRSLRVVSVTASLRPGRLGPRVRNARYIVELQAGRANGLESGEPLTLRGP